MARQRASSNLQGLENEKPIPRGEPDQIINFENNTQIFPAGHEPTGEIIREKSDLYRLQDEDFRLRVHEIETGDHHRANDSINHRSQSITSEYDPVVHRDSKLGRLQLSIRYNNEQNQLIIQILDAQGLIRPEQFYAPDMNLTFSLIGNDNKEFSTEKQNRIIVENSAVLWKEPMVFSHIHKNILEQNLHILATNHTDPSAPRDREILIPLSDLQSHDKEINQWFNLQFVTST
ncbi:unnamed protein product [Adineta steineri]|uniref:C2 domain-containing protein n=1 Tax=Adineta steineri TaxID=433720 RepID=A0A814Q689_9BILA|nr:unnamed protein product [Adineta steineri]